MPASQTVILRVTRQDSDALVQEITIDTRAERPLVVRSETGLRYTLIDPATGAAPREIHVEQSGSDLLVDLDPAREADEPRIDLVLEGCEADPEGLDGRRRREDEEEGAEACALGGYLESDGAWLPYEATDISAFDAAAKGTFVLPGDGGAVLGYLLGGAALVGAAAAAGGGGGGSSTAAPAPQPEPEDPAPEDPQPEDPQPEDPAPGDPQPEDPQPEDPQPEDPAPTAASFVIFGSVAAGPVYTGATVEAYDDQGQLLGSASIADDGSYRIEVAEGASEYQGAVLLRVVDANDGSANFKDEVTGADRSLDTPLRALSWAGEENTLFFQKLGTDAELEINITPITELAAREVIGDSLTPPASKSAIDAGNEGVARAFNLVDENGAPIPLTGPVVTTNGGDFNAEDGVSGAEKYGVALAKLSGMDAATGSIDATLDALEGGYDNGAFSSTAATAIDAGRQAALDALKNQGTEDPTFAGVDTPLNRWVLGDVTIDEQLVSETGLLTVRGTAMPGSTVTVTLPNGAEAQATAGDDGVYEVVSETPVSRAQLAAEPVEAGAADVLAAPTAARAPLAPEVAAKDTAMVSGTGEPNSFVDLIAADGTVLATEVPVDGNGNWQVELAGAPGAGLVVKASYDDGTPSAPIGDLPYTPVVEPVSMDDPITGYAEPGTTVTLTFPDGSTVSADTDPVTGEFTVTNPGGLADGDEVDAVATDAGGNDSAPGTGLVDGAGPTATITVSDSLLEAGETATVTITFSEPVQGFALNDLRADNGSLSNLRPTADPAIYTVTLTPRAGITDDSNVVRLGEGYTDLMGNAGAAAVSPNYAIDTLELTPSPGPGTSPETGPAAPALSQVDGEATITPPVDVEEVTIELTPAGEDAPVEVVIAKNPQSGDWEVQPGPGLPAGAELDPATGEVTIPNEAFEDGTPLTATAVDGDGNESDPGTLPGSGNVDSDAPVAPTVEQVAGETVVTLPADAEAATLELTPAGETDSQTLTLEKDPDTGTWALADGDTLPDGAELDPATGEVTIPDEALADDSTVTATAVDAAGNESEPASAEVSPADASGPTATIELDKATLIAGETATVTVTFSEPVEGFTLADLSAGAGTLSQLAGPVENSDGTVSYTAVLVPAVAVEDTENVVALATGYTDADGNPGSAAQSANYVVDTKANAPVFDVDADGDIIEPADNSDVITGRLLADPADPDSAPVPGGTVTVTFPNGETAEAETDGNGAFAINIPADITLVPGDVVTATAEDPAGNVSAPVKGTIGGEDTTPPLAPTLAQADGETTVTLPADAEAVEVTLTPEGGTEKTVTVAKNPATGEWEDPVDAGLPQGTTITEDPLTGQPIVTIPNEGLEDGTPIDAIAIDGGDNASDPGELPGPVDTAGPAAPTVTQPGTGETVVSLPDDGEETVEVTFTPAGEDTPVTVTLAKDPDTGKWAPADGEGDSLPDGSTVDPDSGEVTIPNTGLEDGTTVTATAIDGVGNESEAGTLLEDDGTTPATVDSTAPDAPTVTQGGGETAVGLPADAETAEVTFTPDGETDPVTVALERDDNGNWVPVDAGAPGAADITGDGDGVVIPNTALADGEDVTATATDAAGNASAPGTLSGDATPPPAPSVEQAEGAVVVGLPADDDADMATVEYTAADGTPQTLELARDDQGAWGPADGTTLPEGVAVDGTTGELTLPNEQVKDATTVTATVADTAGNTNKGSLTADTVAPTAPVIAQDDVDSDGQGETQVVLPDDAEAATVTFTPAGETDPVTVTLAKDPGTGKWAPADDEGDSLPVGSSVDPDTGAVTIPNVALADGSEVTATAADGAGNESVQGELPFVDATAPAITIDALVEGDNAVDAVEAPDVVISGSTTGVENGQTVTVKFTDGADPANTHTVTTTVTDGRWTLDPVDFPAEGLVDGSVRVTATVADAAGNPAPQAVRNLTLDTTVPDQPTLTSVPDDGTSPLTGTVPTTGLEPGTVVQLQDSFGNPYLDDSGNPVQAAVANDGTFSLSNPGLAAGDPVSVVAVDPAGNTSEPATATVAGTDNTPPAAPVIGQTDDDVKVTPPGDAAAVTVSYVDKSGTPVTETVTRNDDGSWPTSQGDLTIDGATGVITLPKAQVEEGAEVSATAADAADNTSDPATLTMDDSGPVAPTLAQADGETTIELPADAETAELTYRPEGATQPVTTTIAKGVDGLWPTAQDAGLPAGSTIDPNDGSITLPNTALEDGEDVTARATDAAGNPGAEGTLAADSAAPAAPVIDQAEEAVTVTPPTDADTESLAVSFTPADATEPTMVTLVDDPTDGWTVADASDPLPAGSSIDPATGEVTIPKTDLEEASEVTATATDSVGNSSEPATATVDDTAPDAPVIAQTPEEATITLPAGAEETTVTFTPADAPANPTTVTLTKNDDGTWPSAEDAGMPAGTAITEDGDGNPVVTIPKDALADPSTLAATATDDAGNESAPAEVLIDDTAPAAPTVEQADGATVATLPEGTEEAVLEYTPQGATAPVETTIAKNPDGSWPSAEDAGLPAGSDITEDPVTGAPIVSIPNDALEDGTPVTATAVDAGGNESDPVGLTDAAGDPTGVDATAPDTPAVTQADGATTAELPADSEEAILEYTPVGTTDPVETTISRNPDGSWPTADEAGLPAGSTISEDAAGNPVISIPNDELADGTPVTATAVDAAGNESEPAGLEDAAGNPATVDATGPEAPAVTQVDGEAVAELPADATEAVITYTPEGAADPVETTITQNPDGSWPTAEQAGLPAGSTIEEDPVTGAPVVSIPNEALAEGSGVTATATDAAGNTGSEGSVAPIDATAPDAPQLNPVTDDATVISGSAEKNSTVTVTFLDGTVETVTADDNGVFSVPVPAGVSLGAGDPVRATATDAAGNESDPANQPVQGTDETPPAKPVLDPVNGDDPITGSAEAGTTVALLDGNGDPITDDNDDPITALVDGNGEFVLDNPGLADDATVQVVATDDAGNDSLPAEATVDATPSVAPAIAQTDGEATVTPPADAGEVTLSYTPAGATEPVTTTLAKDPATDQWPSAEDAGLPAGSTVDPVTGQVTIPNDTLAHDEPLTATATDAAGNESPAAEATIDSEAPPAPTVSSVVEGASNVTGSAEPGSTVTLTFPDGSESSVEVPVSGVYSAPVPAGTTLAAGDPIIAVATDDAGNESASTPATVSGLDSTAPVAPTVNDPASATDPITGTAEPGSTVTLTYPDGSTDEVQADPVTGEFTAPAPTDDQGQPLLGEGDPVTVTATDAAGNESAPATTFVPTTDGTPVTPSVDALTNNDSNDDGTPDSTTVSGVAAPGSTVEVRDPATGAVLGTTTADPVTGEYAVTTDAPLADGESYEVVAVDPADDTKESSPAPVVGDTTAPATPVLDPVNGSEPITGSADPGTTVALLDANGDPILDDNNDPITAVADDNGDFVLENPGLADGTPIQVTASDEVGNESAPAEDTVDAAAPVAPVIEQVDGAVVTDVPADAVTTTISFTPAGASEPTEVTLVKDPVSGWGVADGDTLPEGSTVGADGTVAIPNEALEDGSTVAATVADLAGNESSGLLDPVDSDAPSAPTLAPVGSTDDELTGSADPGSEVTVTFPDGSTASVTADDTGAFTVPVPAGVTLTEGDPIVATAADDAGNESAPATETVAGVDSTAPDQPLINPVNTTDPITGNAEAGATVSLLDGSGQPLLDDAGNPIEAIVNPDGTFTLENPGTLADLDTVQVVATDPAGNASAPASEVVDGEAPAAPQLTQADGNVTVDLLGDGETATINYTTAAGDPRTVELVRDPATSEWAVAGDSPAQLPAGSLIDAVQVSLPVTSLEHASPVTATVTDDAGNESEPASELVDNQAPTAPDLDVPLLDNIGPGSTAITGVAEPGSEVTITLPDGTELTTTAGAEGGAFAVDLPDGVTLEEGQPVVATATDSAGNESDPATEYVGGTAGPEAPVIEQAAGDTVVTLPADGVDGFADPATAAITYELAGGGTETALLDRTAGGDWQLAANQTLSASPQVTADGTVTFANTALPNGSEITAIAYNADETLASDEVSLVVDSAAPAPALTQLADSVELTVPADAETAELTFTPAGATDPVTVTVAKDPVTGEWGVPADEADTLPADSTIDPATGTVTVPNDGLAEGSSVTATATDGAGNESPEETLDLAPTAPTIEQADGAVTVTLPGEESADAATVSYTDAAGNPQTVSLGKNDEGAWSAEGARPAGVTVTPEGVVTLPNDGIQDGSDVTATATATGGTPDTDDDLTSAPATLTTDSGAPGVPAVAQEDGAVLVALPADEDVASAEVTFTPDDGAETTVALVNDPVEGWQVADGSDPLPDGSVLDPATGEVTIPNEALEDGTPVIATAIDEAGNASDPGTLPGDVDSTAPTAPTVEQPGDGTTAVTLPGEDEEAADVTFTPAGEADPVTVTLAKDPGGNWVVEGGSEPLPAGSTVDPATGKVTIPNEALADDTPVTATASDPAGNESDAGTLLEDDGTTPATVDSSAPIAPVLEAIDAADTLLTGTAEPGATVLLTFPDGTTQETVANSSGNFTVAAPADLNPGDVVTARQTDEAGNLSDPANKTVSGEDTTAPAAPTATLANVDDDGNGEPDGSTVSGKAEPGSTVEVVDDAGTVLGTATTDAEGDYVVELDEPLEDGVDYDVVARDAAGNPSDPTTVTGDTTPPGQPAIASVTNSDSTGDGTPDETVVTGSVPTDQGIESIELRDPDGNIVGTATPDGTGDFTITTDEPLADGTDYELVAVDGAGNESTPATVAGDTSAPNPPPARLADIVDSGTKGDNITKVDNRELVLSNSDGSATEGDTITVYAADGTTVLGTTTVGDRGDWSVTLDSDTADGETDNDPYTEGSYDFKITATDPAGNVSAPTELTVEVDTTVPAPPTITGPGENDTLNDATPTVTGTGTPGDTVTLYGTDGTDGTTPIGETTVGPDGTWVITPADEDALADGAQTLTAKATDPAGNEEPTGDSVSVDVATSLAAPTASLATASDSAPEESGVSGSNDDALTNDDTPTLEGTGTAGDTITVYDGPNPATAAVLGTTAVDDQGAWSFTIPDGSALDDGDYNLAVTATRGALESSAVTVPVTVDTTVAQPVLSLDPASDSGTAGDGITSDATPTVTGSGAVAGDVIKLYADNDSSYTDGSEIGSATVAADGTWSITPTSDLSGSVSLTAKSFDSAGNESTPSAALAVKIVSAATDGPQAGIDQASDSGTLGDGTTTDPTPTISGSGATPGDTITLYDEDGVTPLGTTTVDENGDWAITPTEPLSEGATDLQVTSTDAAGSESPATTVAVTVDTTAPTLTVTRVSGDELASGETTGTFNAAERWSDADDYGDWTVDVHLNPFIRGTSDAPDGSAVVGTLNGVIFTTTVFEGEWAFGLSDEQSKPLVHGAVYDISVTVTDPAGNSVTDASKKLAVDLLTPDVPTVDVLRTTDTTPVITGKAQKVDPNDSDSYVPLASGDTLRVLVNDVEVVGTVGGLPEGLSYDGDTGSWSLDTAKIAGLSEGFSLGQYEVSVYAEAAGVRKYDYSANELFIGDPGITIEALSGGFINEAEAGQPQVITGSTTDVQAGSVVTITARPTVTKTETGGPVTLGTAVVQTDGRYSLNLSQTALADLLAGTENGDATNDVIVLEASVEDYGTTVSDSSNTVVDVTPPAIVDLADLTETSLGRTGDGTSTDYSNPITSTVANSGTEALVTPTVEPNATVEVYFQRQNVTVEVTADENGAFTLPVPDVDAGGNTFILYRNDRIIFTPTDEAGNVGEPWVEYYDPVPLISDVLFIDRDGERFGNQLNAGNLIDEQTVDTTELAIVSGTTVPYAEVAMRYLDDNGVAQTVTTTADEFGAYSFELLTGKLIEGTFDLSPVLVDRTDDNVDNPATVEVALTSNNTSATIEYIDAGGSAQTLSVTRNAATGALSVSGIPAGSGITVEGNSVFLPTAGLQGASASAITGATEVVPNSVPERVVPEGQVVTVAETYSFATEDPARLYREVDDGTINQQNQDWVLIRADFNRDVIVELDGQTIAAGTTVAEGIEGASGSTLQLKVLVGDEVHYADLYRVDDGNSLIFKLDIEPGMTDLDGLSIPVSDTQVQADGMTPTGDASHNLDSSDPAIVLVDGDGVAEGAGALIYDRERYQNGSGTKLDAWLDYEGRNGNGTPDNFDYQVDTTAPEASVTIYGVSTQNNWAPDLIDGDPAIPGDDATEVGDFTDELTATQYSNNQAVWIGGRVDGEYNVGDRITLTVRYLDFPDGFNEQSAITASDDPANPSVSPELVEKTITVTTTVQADGTWRATMRAQDLAADADLRLEARLDTFDPAGNRSVELDSHEFTLGFFNVMSAQGLNDIADVSTDRDPATSTNLAYADLYGSMNNDTLLPFLQNTGNFGSAEEGTQDGIYDKNVNVITDYNWGLSYSDMRVSTVMFEGETQTFGDGSDWTLNTYSTARWGDKYYTANHFVRDGKVLIIANDNWHYGAFKYDTETQVNPYRWYDGGSLAAAFDFVGTYDEEAIPYAKGALVGLDPETGLQSASYNVNFIDEAALDALPAAADAIEAAKQILDGAFGSIYGETLTVASEADTFTIHERALTDRDVVLARDDNGNAVIVLRQHGAGYVLLSADQDILDSANVGDAASTGSVEEILAGNAFSWADQYGARPVNARVDFETRPEYQSRYEGGQGWYYYRVGDTVSVKLTVAGDAQIDTSGGTPTIDLEIAGEIWQAEFREAVRTERDAYYNQTQLIFDFTITDQVESDYWYYVTPYSEGIHLPGNGFDANGATVTIDGETNATIEYSDYRRSYEPYPDGYKYNPYQTVNTEPATPRTVAANLGLGFDVQSAGDFNGDGFEDFMVSAPGLVDGGSNREGRVYVVYGSETGLPGDLDLENLKASEGVIIDTSYVGGDNWGFRMLENLGDFNGDGYDEIMMTGHYADSTVVIWGGDRSTEGDGSYVIRIREEITDQIYSGKDGFQITGDGAWMGTAGGAGDFNNDGYADIIVSNAETSYGKATIIYGGDFKPNETGGVVSAGSDVMSNVFISFSNNHDYSGPIKRVSGNNWELMDSTDLSMQGSGSNSSIEWFGGQMAGYVDLNNDGLQDLVISDPYANGAGLTNSGSVWVIYGQAGKHIGEGYDYYESLGYDILDYHDYYVANSGVEHTDLLVSGLEAMVADGVAVRFDGTQTNEALGGILGTVTRESLVQGQSIRSLGDINGDGFADFAIASPSYGNTSDTVTGDGRVYVMYGSASGLVLTSGSDADNVYQLGSLSPSAGFTIEQATAASGLKDANAHFGFSVQGMGDINGDGIDDFMIGAPEADGETLLNNGAVYLVFGGSAALPMMGNTAYAESLVASGHAVKFEGLNVRDYMGTNMAMGDWNGDGLADFVIPSYASETFTLNAEDPVFGQGTVTTNAGTFTVAMGSRYAEMTAAFDTDPGNLDDVIATTGGQNRDGGVARVTGGLGDDTITGIGANAGDVGYGGHGDDTVAVTSLAFTRVDGGLGIDTLRVDGGGLALDLGDLGRRVQGFETFDIGGSGANSLTLRLSDVLDQPEQSGVDFENLKVLGDSDDAVVLDGGLAASGGVWESKGSQSVDGVTYNVYSHTALEDSNVFDDVWIQQGITVS
jgi:hypothetical protein